MNTIAICNHKGGSGKTTTAFYLGTLLAEAGHRTLLIDLDPQANLSGRFLYDADCSVADALGGATPPSVGLCETVVTVETTERGRLANLFLAPSAPGLANTALGLLNDPFRGRSALRRALPQVAGNYAYCLVDCPPEAGILLANALLAADGVLCPGEPEPDAIAGIAYIARQLEVVRAEFGRTTPLMLGCVAARVDLRTNLHREHLEVMRKSLLAPLRCTVPAASGENREERLRYAYGSLAMWLINGGGHA